ncbi:hypothetical protein L484_018523 [Morus notabilis]|uniref:Uncharacterized protein n=1 Tax=Morus notabilis TaxID=981085 RepID=W9SSJ8_9ROSA|nr:hypothetical protein L484_018523 [Morus notabilis]
MTKSHIAIALGVFMITLTFGSVIGKRSAIFYENKDSTWYDAHATFYGDMTGAETMRFLVLLARSLLVSVRRLPFPVFIFFNFYDNDRQNAHMLSLILIFSGFVLVRLQELGEARSQAQQAHFSRVYNMKKFGSFAFSVTSLRGKPPLAMNF